MAESGRCCDFASLERVCEALAQPVWIVTGAGHIVHCNAAASAVAPEVTKTVRVASSDEFDDPGFAVSRLALDDNVLSLVVARNVVIDPPLPPSLARVASLAAGGLADKEIAHRLDASVATVRTYMRRIYARLGVRSRAELARRWSRR